MQTGLDTDQLIIVGFLAIIFLIIAAAIFVPSFQEKVLGGSEGETSIGGFITVKGASFVLLIIGMASLITYLSVQRNTSTQDGSESPPAAPTTAAAIKVLETATDDQYSLRFEADEQVGIIANNTLLGSTQQNFTLKLDKSKINKASYDIQMGDARISSLQVDLKESRLIDDGYGKIEEIKSVQTSKGLIAKYQFRFGEGDSENTIQWTENTFEYSKSDDGRQSETMNFLQDAKWNSSYAIALGAGLFGGGDNSLHIEKINIYLVEIKLTQVQ